MTPPTHVRPSPDGWIAGQRAPAKEGYTAQHRRELWGTPPWGSLETLTKDHRVYGRPGEPAAQRQEVDLLMPGVGEGRVGVGALLGDAEFLLA